MMAYCCVPIIQHPVHLYYRACRSRAYCSMRTCRSGCSFILGALIRLHSAAAYKALQARPGHCRLQGSHVVLALTLALASVQNCCICICEVVKSLRNYEDSHDVPEQ